MAVYENEFFVKKGLFSTKIVNIKGKVLDLSHSAFKVKALKDDQFVLVDKNGNQSVSFSIIKQYKDGTIRGITSDNKFCEINLELGNISSKFVASSGNVYANEDGELFLLNERQEEQPLNLHCELSKGTDSPYIKQTSYPFYTIIKDESGKCGAIDDNGRLVCPLLFDSMNITVSNKFTNFLTFIDDKKMVIIDNHGNVVYEEERNSNLEFEYDIVTSSIYYKDKQNNTTTFLKLNPITKKLEPEITHNKNICSRIIIENKEYFVTKGQDGFGLIDSNENVILKEEYKQITTATVNTHNKPKKNVIKLTTNNNRVGVYDVVNQKTVLAPEYTDIEFEASAIDTNGVFKFFVENENRKWGVVNSNGEQELPFEYSHSTSSKIFTQRETKNGTQVEQMVITDKNGDKAYINVLQKNIVADASQQAEIQAYSNRLKSIPDNKTEKQKETYKEVSKYTEEEKIAAAVVASAIFESPIAGFYAYNQMDDVKEVVREN